MILKTIHAVLSDILYELHRTNEKLDELKASKEEEDKKKKYEEYTSTTGLYKRR